eukprot:8070262-Prorocentrum_lima.AAC.1
MGVLVRTCGASIVASSWHLGVTWGSLVRLAGLDGIYHAVAVLAQDRYCALARRFVRDGLKKR